MEMPGRATPIEPIQSGMPGPAVGFEALPQAPTPEAPGLLHRAAAMVGNIATRTAAVAGRAYEGVTATVGMVQAGVTPWAAAARNRLGSANPNTLRRVGLAGAAVIGGVALGALARHSGFEMGGAGRDSLANHSDMLSQAHGGMQLVADTAPLAEGGASHAQTEALKTVDEIVGGASAAALATYGGVRLGRRILRARPSVDLNDLRADRARDRAVVANVRKDLRELTRRTSIVTAHEPATGTTTHYAVGQQIRGGVRLRVPDADVINPIGYEMHPDIVDPITGRRTPHPRNGTPIYGPGAELIHIPLGAYNTRARVPQPRTAVDPATGELYPAQFDEHGVPHPNPRRSPWRRFRDGESPRP